MLTSTLLQQLPAGLLPWRVVLSVCLSVWWSESVCHSVMHVYEVSRRVSVCRRILTASTVRELGTECYRRVDGGTGAESYFTISAHRSTRLNSLQTA